jgi:hypothetical protein
MKQAERAEAEARRLPDGTIAVIIDRPFDE